MDRLKSMKEILIGQVQAQLGNIHNADCEELGAAIDMIKDLEEAMYYCTITKAMEDKEDEKHQVVYYTETRRPEPYYRDMDRDSGRMYYSGDGSGSGSTGSNGNSGSSSGSNGGRGGTSWYREYDYQGDWRDEREGRSPMKRKMYMESKQMHKDKTSTMRDLEEYAQELTQDVVEMVKDATPEEKAMLQKKISALATKIV